MKWIIVFLVLANVVFFGWQLARDEKAMVEGDTIPPETTSSAVVNRLLLVNELERGVLRYR